MHKESFEQPSNSLFNVAWANWDCSASSVRKDDRRTIELTWGETAATQIKG